MGLIGQASQDPDPSAPRIPYLPADHADRLVAILKTGIATPELARMMASDPEQVLVAARHLKDLAAAAVDQQQQEKAA